MNKKTYIYQYATHENCDWNILRAMLCTFSSAELFDILDDEDESMITSAIYSILKQREEKSAVQRPHYLSVNQLLTNYRTKGKKGIARKELQKRLLYFSYTEQQQVLRAFLQGCQTDCNWALNFLLNHWDSRFEKDVISLFEQRHNNASARVICKWGKPEYISKHLKELSKADSYLHARLRLPSEDPIDRTQLTDNEYLYLAAKLHLKFAVAEAYSILLKHLMQIKDSNLIGLSGHLRFNSLAEFSGVKHILWCLGELQQFEVLQWFAYKNEVTKPMFTANDTQSIVKELCL